MVVGPAWTRGEIERPAGTKDMGSWTAAVYTPEQQARLGVDEQGNKVPAAATAGSTTVAADATAVGEAAAAAESPSKEASGSSRDEDGLASTISVHVTDLSGKKVTLQVSGASCAMELQRAAARALGSPLGLTRMVVGNGASGTVLDVALGGRVDELGLEPDCELTAVVVSRLRVRRHVYQARGGAPPHRGTFLVATDEVELDADVELRQQVELLSPAQYSWMSWEEMADALFTLPHSPEGAPRQWDQGALQVAQAGKVDAGATAREALGCDSKLDIALVLPMRGMD